MPPTLDLDSKAPQFAPEPSVAFQRPNAAVFRFAATPKDAENPLRYRLATAPTFVVPGDPGLFRWWSSLKTALIRVPADRPALRGEPLRVQAPGKRGYFRGRSWTMSLACHAAAILLIVYAHEQFPDSVSAFETPIQPNEVIYYRVPVHQLPKTLPHIAPPGPGGRPLTGMRPIEAPAAGSTTSQNVLTIVSKPAHPDNNHQTIIQPSSPPDLKINVDLKLPNIILGKPIDAPKAPLKFDPAAARPTQKSRQVKADVAPTPDAQNSPNPEMTFLTPPAFKPSMPVATASGVAQRKSTSGTGNVQAPNVSATSGDSLTLAVISTDPGVANAAEIMLPPGNRSGEFSTTVGENAIGTPGGSRAGVVGGGPGTAGKGGDSSSGPGSATSGGGGLSMSEGPVTINGEGTNSVGSGMLGAALARGIVYPVPAVFNIRKPSLIVSAGAQGGGGLDAYGALQHCGKIYTIFMPMPGKNWTLQYCSQTVPQPAVAEPANVVHFGGGLVPPSAEAKFDFQRSAVPPEKTGRMIILKGLLRADGLIDQLEVYQGVSQEMDDNARLAFSQWKFKAALQEGKPVPVQVLVGIPATIPVSANASADH